MLRIVTVIVHNVMFQSATSISTFFENLSIQELSSYFIIFSASSACIVFFGVHQKHTLQNGLLQFNTCNPNTILRWQQCCWAPKEHKGQLSASCVQTGRRILCSSLYKKLIHTLTFPVCLHLFLKIYIMAAPCSPTLLSPLHAKLLCSTYLINKKQKY